VFFFFAENRKGQTSRPCALVEKTHTLE